MSISVKYLTRNYGEQRAVNRISFQIGKGEIVGFLGPNGAGKSTTMKMITGYLPPDEGEIMVCGINAVSDKIQSKSKIGYLPEANPLYTDMFVREYLDFIAGVHAIPDGSKRIEEVIKMVGLVPEANKKIGQLSKGYKQRVGLAAALLHDPEVLILDEPTSGLDPNQILEIREVIRQLGKNKTVLFSSHIMQEVEAICDRVIIINKGNIVADDKLSNLQKVPKSTNFVRVEFKEDVNTDLLKKLHGVLEVFIEQGSSTSGGRSIINIQCADADALKKELLQLSIENNLNIVSLQSETKNLEEIFRKLTQE